MSPLKSAADDLHDRVIRVDVVDRDGVRAPGALIKLSVNNRFVGDARIVEGPATFQVNQSVAAVILELEYQDHSERVVLDANTDHWQFRLPFSNEVHLVILIHGINTRAQWTSIIKPALEHADLKAALAGYGVYGVLRFLIPIDALRRQAVKRVIKKIRAAIQIHKPQKVSVIAHSFGSYIVARALSEEPDLSWHRIIFCGSVIPENFPLENYLSRIDLPIINEIGTNDFLPALAECSTWGYGSVGSYGFQHPAVEERWHAGFWHSDFLTADFCKKFWIPFLRVGRIEKADQPSALPFLIRLLVRLPLRLIVLVLIVFIGYFVWSLFRY